MDEAPEKAFQNEKKQALKAVDLSRKGSIDLPIQELIEFINNEKDIYTTSSCSGRIIVFSEGSEKKRGCVWIHVSHKEVDKEDLVSQLMAPDLDIHGVIMFKFEPFVLHCQCRTMHTAQTMLRCALDAGFRNSGLVVGKRKRIIMAVRSTHGMEVPIAFEGKLAVSLEPELMPMSLPGTDMWKMHRIWRRTDSLSGSSQQSRCTWENPASRRCPPCHAHTPGIFPWPEGLELLAKACGLKEDNSKSLQNPSARLTFVTRNTLIVEAHQLGTSQRISC